MSFESVRLPDEMDYLYRPVLAGMCREESLYDGTLDLGRVAAMNDVLDVRAENQARYEDAVKAQG